MKRDLLIRAYEIIGGIPAARFNLNQTAYNSTGDVNVHASGTIGCALGWLGLHPEFQALGLVTHTDGTLSYPGVRSWYADIAKALFDLPLWEAERLFGPEKGLGCRLHKARFLKSVRECLTSHHDEP